MPTFRFNFHHVAYAFASTQSHSFQHNGLFHMVYGMVRHVAICYGMARYGVVVYGMVSD